MASIPVDRARPMTTPDTVVSPQLAPRPAVAPGSPERFTGDVLVGAVVTPEEYALAAGAEGA
jgi:hypothetical protein